jgi:hypothetical protein
MSEKYYSGEEKKQVSFENWLKDERLDRQAGITPTHPGHSVDSPSRWSGQGKGDVDKLMTDAYFENYDKIFSKPELDDDVIRVKYRPGGKIFVVSTSEGKQEMSEEEYKKYKKNK